MPKRDKNKKNRNYWNAALIIGMALLVVTTLVASVFALPALLNDDSPSKTQQAPTNQPTQQNPTNDSQEPQAGVTFDQDDADSGYDVTVQVVSMQNADKISVRVGEGTPQQITGDESTTSVGDSLTVTASNGQKVTVTATLNGKTSIIQTYTTE